MTNTEQVITMYAKPAIPMYAKDILGMWNYVTVRIDDDGHVTSIGDMFTSKVDAIRYCTEMNLFADDDSDEYHVVRIASENEAEDLRRCLRMVIERVTEQMEVLADRNVGTVFGDMSRSDLLNYECDLAAYNELSSALAFMRGVLFHTNISVPDGPEFPSPEI